MDPLNTKDLQGQKLAEVDQTQQFEETLTKTWQIDKALQSEKVRTL